MLSGRKDTGRFDSLEAQSLFVHYGRHARTRRKGSHSDAVSYAVDDVSLGLARGETYVLVGESGSGKSTVARCLAGLQKPTAGQVLLRSPEAGDGTVIGPHRSIQMVFQDPVASLDPRQAVINIVLEGLCRARMRKPEKVEAAKEALSAVKLDNSYLQRYPRELSGGQRQRVSVARAIVGRPDFIVADEPVSALDPSMRGAIIELLQNLQSEVGFGMFFVTHDIGLLPGFASHIGVMHKGLIVEEGQGQRILRNPRDGYTKQLMRSSRLTRADVHGDGTKNVEAENCV